MEAYQRVVRTAIGMITLASLVGCGVFAGSGAPSKPTFVSAQTGDALELVYPGGVYSETDNNTADLYFTTIPGIGQPGVSLNGVSGSVLHIHMFLKPRAGQTPIDFTAANVTVTHVIVSEGAVGVYGGAGFMLPSGDAGASTFGGRLRDVTLRPTAHSDGFADQLGWNELAGTMRAKRDPDRASQIAAWIDAVMTSDAVVDIAAEPG